MPIGKEEVSLSLFENEVILYIAEPETVRRALDLAREFHKVAGYKISNNTKKINSLCIHKQLHG